MKPLHPSTVAASRQSAANLWTLRNAPFCLPRRRASTAGRKPFRLFCTLRGLAIAVALQLGMFVGSAQTNIYLFSRSKTNIPLPPGTYIITAYGALGGGYGSSNGGLGAEMSAEFNFSTSTTLTLLVGGGGDSGGSGGGGG